MVKRKIIIGLITTFMMCNLFGCGKSENGENNAASKSEKLTSNVKNEEITDVELDEEFIRGTANFSVEIFKAGAMENLANGENVLISPHSVATALSMTANGANGDTLTQMEQVMTGGMDISKYNEYMYTYNNFLQTEDIEFNTANSLWIKDDEKTIQVKEDFLNTCSTYYNADVFKAYFDESTVSDINKWVSKETDEMIPTFLEEIPEDVVMYLINAITFEGEWASQYEDHQVHEDSVFTNSKGEEEKVNMLCEMGYLYVENDRATGFVKYYEGGECLFMAILPKEEGDISEYVKDLTGDEILELYDNKSEGIFYTEMPEFSYEYEVELSEPLKDMGMELPFNTNADFSNMATTDTGYLYINRVLHKTYIEVNQAGTRAAAATAVEMTEEGCAEPPTIDKEVILNRPFVYAIVNNRTGLPIFMGVVNSVE